MHESGCNNLYSKREYPNVHTGGKVDVCPFFQTLLPIFNKINIVWKTVESPDKEIKLRQKIYVRQNSELGMRGFQAFRDIKDRLWYEGKGWKKRGRMCKMYQ